MTTLLHLSDTHFGTELPAVMSALWSAVSEITPDIVLLSGDITQRARRSQFERARHFIDSLQVERFLAIPGNHDIPLYNLYARFLSPYRNYEAFFGTRERSLVTDTLVIFGFDATSPWLHTRGRIDPDRMRTVFENALLKRRSQDMISAVCIHQPLCTLLPEDSDEILINHERIANLLAEYRIDLVLSGHVHVPFIISTAQVLPHTAPFSIFSGAGTAVSWRTRPQGPNSFNSVKFDLSLSPPTAVVTKYVYAPQLSTFCPACSVTFLRTEKGWLESVT